MRANRLLRFIAFCKTLKRITGFAICGKGNNRPRKGPRKGPLFCERSHDLRSDRRGPVKPSDGRQAVSAFRAAGARPVRGLLAPSALAPSATLETSDVAHVKPVASRQFRPVQKAACANLAPSSYVLPLASVVPMRPDPFWTSHGIHTSMPLIES